MCGTFENVKILTRDERIKQDGGKYYIYNLLCNNRVYNMYSQDWYDFDSNELVTVTIELGFYKGTYNAKLVGVE